MERFSCYWKNVRLKHPLLERLKKASKSFSCYWKNVRLKQPCNVGYPGKIPGFSCYWKNVRLKLSAAFCRVRGSKFQLLLKECTIEASWRRSNKRRVFVSVVIERMYDWSAGRKKNGKLNMKFQLLLKECTIEAGPSGICGIQIRKFQLLLKECTIEAFHWKIENSAKLRFSCYWKNVRLKLRNQLIENKRFLTVGFWSVFRKWSICTKSAIIFENLGWLLDCFW